MADVEVAVLPDCARISVRAGRTGAAAIGAAIGVPLGDVPCRANVAADRAALWLGPDEWLLMGLSDDAPALIATAGDAPGDEPASVVDVSHRTIAVQISGARSEEVLNAFCALDLDTHAFPVGMCTRTVFGKAEIVLWRTAPQTFWLEVARSFAPYVQGCLAEAARELTA
ncbi:MAG TPA: sarcosine oxidase subunit gamma family protein [Acetobacteraceae bacterium]|nr:sarcosine oxidase subunit gamma family protein [Acetobacteraceae bacterium]